MANRVEFKAESGRAASGELSVPEGTGKVPAVVLVQEWWGVNDHIRSLADRFAKAGFLVLAPDLYHGTVTKDAGKAAELMQSLDGKQAIDDIAGAVAYLRAHPRSNGKVGITGFCMGGAYTFAATSAIPNLGAAVPFYGIPPAERLDVNKMKTPILTHVATRDQWVTPEKAEELVRQINAHGGNAKVEIYEADHAFMNDTRPEVYAPEQAKLAWDRAVEFLHRHLD
ncbi:Dienelactone hydrolase family protein [Minicystis rosea]|nr:Dienelactone hydrolase family protein [Minicystis rosea]